MCNFPIQRVPYLTRWTSANHQVDLFTASGIPVREYVRAVQAVLGRTHDDEGGCVREGV